MSEKKKKKENELDFFGHLEELRKRLFYSLVAVFVVFIFNWFIADDIYRFLARPVTKFLPPGEKLAFTSLTSPFLMYLKVAFLAAIFFASPFIMWQMWLFISPALYEHEKKFVIPFILSSTFFFLAGGAFGYFVVFPWACRFFIQLGKDFRPVITIDSYFDLAIKILLGLGVVFEIPVVAFILARLGLLSPKFMLKNFKYAVLIAFIVAAIITPTPDAITQTIVAGPFILLYVISIGITYIAYKKRKEDDLAG